MQCPSKKKSKKKTRSIFRFLDRNSILGLFHICTLSEIRHVFASLNEKLCKKTKVSKKIKNHLNSSSNFAIMILSKNSAFCPSKPVEQDFSAVDFIQGVSL
jgi:hypothetical protein